jgi:hypothetical protein
MDKTQDPSPPVADPPKPPEQQSPSLLSFKLPEKLPEALLMLILTASCYLLIFWYESGYCSYFNINPAFIHPDLFTMLGSGIGAILVLALLLAPLGSLLQYGMSITDKSLVNRLCTLLVGTICILLTEWVRDFSDFTMLFALVAFWACMLIPCLANHIRRKPVFKAVMTLSLSIGLLYCVSGVAYCYGLLKAKTAKQFYFRTSPRREVVLRVYGSIAITAPIDSTNNVYPDFCFVKMEGETNSFALRRLGRLTPQLPDKGQPQPAQVISETKTNQPTITTNQIIANQTGTVTNASRTP